MPVPDTCSIPGRKNARSNQRSGGRSQRTIRRLAMQKERPVRDRDGKIIFERFHGDKPQLDGRIEPNRKWFGNTRVVGQTELDKMREVIVRETKPNQFLLQNQKLPQSLIRDVEPERPKLELIEPFHETFGKKATRRRAKHEFTEVADLAKNALEQQANYDQRLDMNTEENKQRLAEQQKNPVDGRLARGATSRIYSEIYKVIDSSDVICYVLDARDPDGTRSNHVETHLRLPENEHRHLIYILNKVDLVPIWATKSWINRLQQIHPVIAYNAAARKPFGKAELISVLRQFSRLHKDRPNISVGFLGYPNVGKSSVINSLIGKQSCKVAPIPGETKVWQYVNLTKKIFLIDAPGVVFPGLQRPTLQDNSAAGGYKGDTKYILQGVIRCEYIDYPEHLVPEILDRVQKEHVARTYLLRSFKDGEDLMEQLARKWGRLLKGGEPDKRAVARRLLEDFVRGRLPHFRAPYSAEDIEEHKNTIKREREHWQHQTDSELIRFVNRQRLSQAGQEFAFLNRGLTDEQKALLEDDEAVPQGSSEEESSASTPARAPAPAEPRDGEFMLQEDSGSEVQGFESEDVDQAFDMDADETAQRRASLQHEPKPGLVMKQKKRLRHTEGIKRATRIFQTKNTELLRAASSGVVDEADLRKVVRPHKEHKKKPKRGGYGGQKTGVHFYDQRRLERSQSAHK